jgi:hypothetical protein
MAPSGPVKMMLSWIRSPSAVVGQHRQPQALFDVVGVALHHGPHGKSGLLQLSGGSQEGGAIGTQQWVPAAHWAQNEA